MLERWIVPITFSEELVTYGLKLNKAPRPLEFSKSDLMGHRWPRVNNKKKRFWSGLVLVDQLRAVHANKDP
jgi:hypothetical protein